MAGGSDGTILYKRYLLLEIKRSVFKEIICSNVGKVKKYTCKHLPQQSNQ
jgi:hypothetical protein